ncbi:hypothetical protein ACOCJ7_07115 [Knoellia sp. CPCC 206453]|uniref:hypothetical protein n=1 Tax=Knoellia pratensis TaxID=3404796 RepID=UPI0036098315
MAITTASLHEVPAVELVIAVAGLADDLLGRWALAEGHDKQAARDAWVEMVRDSI